MASPILRRWLVESGEFGFAPLDQSQHHQPEVWNLWSQGNHYDFQIRGYAGQHRQWLPTVKTAMVQVFGIVRRL